MARPSVPALLLVASLAVSGVLSDDGPAKWSQRSASNGGWIPLDTPCETCRPAGADQETQASSAFGSEAAPAPAPAQPQVVFRDTAELRPPPVPLRVQRQEGGQQRPAPELYITDQRPPPPPVAKPHGGKQGRDQRHFYNQNPPRHQLNFLPDNSGYNPQQDRVVFPTVSIASQIPQQGGILHSGRQPSPFLGQSQESQPQRPQPFLRQQQAQQQSALHNFQNQQNHKHQQQLTQNAQLQHPQKQIKFQQDQFPIFLPQNSIPTPHGFQSPQLQLLPVPHGPQPSIPPVDLQGAIQQQIHHQINQQLLGAPFVPPFQQFPPSAFGQQLQYTVRNPPLGPANLQLVPQQQPSQSIQPPQAVNQQIELTPSPKPEIQTVPKTQSDAPSPPKEAVKTNHGTAPEEEVQEEVQLLYVPVEALRQRGRVNKEVVRGQSQEQNEKLSPDRQAAHSFQIKHYHQGRPSLQSTEPFRANKGASQVGLDNANVKYTQGENVRVNHEQVNVQNLRPTQAQPANVGVENQRFAFTPPIPQSFHDNIQLQGQRQVIYQGAPTRNPIPDTNYRIQTLENLQQEEQQRVVNQQQAQQQRQPQRERQPHRKPTRVPQDNSQNVYQNDQRQVSQSFQGHSTPRPTTALPNPSYPTTPVSSPTSPAPYQPPLSVYMEDFDGQGSNHLTVDDVLKHLNGADTVPVLEQAGSSPPKVFVGPSALPPPKGYAKFELPYLSMLDMNRVERKVDRLPFFVAPLSFQPPPGYAKIPFPAPHVGSVVVSSTPVQSSTESVSSASQTTASTLSHQVNSLQSSSVSPGNVELVPTTDNGPEIITLTSQQPPIHQTGPKQQNRHQLHRQQHPPSAISQPQFHRQQFSQQRLQPQQPQPQEFQQQQFQQQQFQQEQQQHLLQQQFPPQQVTQQRFPQQLYSQQQALQQDIPQHDVSQQQPEQEQYQSPTPSQQPTYLLYTTPSPSISPIYFSSSSQPTTSSTTTTTTTTTTTPAPPPEVRGQNPQRGRGRYRQSYSQNNSPDVDSNYRNRGSYRLGSNSDSTRQPSVRTRRPWDGRRRPSTTTELPSTSEVPNYDSYDKLLLNPVSPSNQVLQSTVKSSVQIQNLYSNDHIKEVSPPTIVGQEYSKDDPYTQSTITDDRSQDGQLRSQGAFVLTAFQHPQVLGDVVNGQIQRPENTNSFRNYYDGNRENSGPAFEGSHNSQTSPNIRTQVPAREQRLPSHFESQDVAFNQNNGQRNSFSNQGVAHSQATNAESNDAPTKSPRPFGHHRAQEPSNTPNRQFYSDNARGVTQGTIVESHYPVTTEQEIHNAGGAYRNYNQPPNTAENPVQNAHSQSAFPSQFTPSIQISDAPHNEQTTSLPNYSPSSPVSQQPQIFIISTPIPSPTHSPNRSYVSPQNFAAGQNAYQVQQHSSVADIVNQGFNTNSGHQEEQAGHGFNIANNQEGGIVEQGLPQVPHRFQTTTTEQTIIDVQTEGEPKRTKLRQPQRTYTPHRSQESSETVEEERPRHRQQQFRNNGETRTRQPSQRTRSRYHTTESPVDEEVAYQPQRHQRYRGRQRVVPTQNTQENTQYLDEEVKQAIPQRENIPAEVPRTTYPTVVEREPVSRPQSQQVVETYEAGGDVNESHRTQSAPGQFRTPELSTVPQTHLSQEKSPEVERPTNVRSRGRFRGSGERGAVRQRGQAASYSSQENIATTNAPIRSKDAGQRYLGVTRHHIFQDAPFQEQNKPQDDTQPLVYSFDGSQQNAPNYPKQENEDGGLNKPINSLLATEIVNLNPIQESGNDGISLVPQNEYSDAQQYKQPSSNEDRDTYTQEFVTTEAPTTISAAKPVRKYNNFAARPRRPSQSANPINAFPSTPSPPETTTGHKVYTVRPTRRPTTKAPGTATTRARIRRPTKPTTTTTTTTTTTESPYFLTTAAPAVSQGDIPPYEQNNNFGRGNFRARKRPVAVSRRPKPSSNEVQEEQEEESPRVQGSYRQRVRGSSRRVSTLPPEQLAPQYRHPEEEQLSVAQISGPIEEFKSSKNKANDDSYETSQHNIDQSNFQISLPEEQFPLQIPTKVASSQGKIKNVNQIPVYQPNDYYYPQDSQQQQEVQEPRLKYQNPPVRPVSFSSQEETDYAYEQSSQQTYQALQHKPQGNKESAQFFDSGRQRAKYDEQPQDFVINFSGLTSAADTSYAPRDELDSGEESRYFDKHVNIPPKSPSKITKYSETKTVPLEEIVEIVDSGSLMETSDESEKIKVSSESTSEVVEQPEPTSDEGKEISAESEEKGSGQPIKKVPGRRRGNWVRVRTKTIRRRPGDMLEAAESQNLATVSQNLLQFNPSLKEKSEAPPLWVDPAPAEEKPEEKAEEPIPVEEENEEDNIEAFDITVPESESVVEPEEIGTSREESEEVKDEPVEEPVDESADEPAEETLEVVEDQPVDDESSAERESFENEEFSKEERRENESRPVEVPSSDIEPPQTTEPPIPSTVILRDEPEKTEVEDDENEISENVEQKTTLSESSTEPMYNESNETDEKSEFTTEETTSITTDSPTPRVLGTSTTTEISLETEICYRGRCVKTKVDADQVPIE